MTNLIAYGNYTKKDVQRNRAELTRAKGAGELYKLTPGKHVLRILPARAGQRPFVVSAVHYLSVAARDKKLVFACPRIHAQQPCPACAEHDRLRTSKDPRERGRAKDYAPSVAIYCNVIDRREEAGDPKSMRLPQSVHDELEQYLEDEDEPIDFLHPLEGYDAIIVRKGNTLETTRYSMRLAARPSPLADKIEDTNMLISSQPDLEKRNQVKPAAKLTQLMRGKVDSKKLTSGARQKPRHQCGKGAPPVVEGELDEDDDFLGT